MSKLVLLVVAVTLILCGLSFFGSHVPAQTNATLPKVLLVGDSISIYYEPFVKEMLAGKAAVKHSGHAESTKTGLKMMPKILAQKWDVIHFNWGLHDLKEGGKFVPIDEYEVNLREIVKQLKTTGAKLVWASTTPVGTHSGDRSDENVVLYNAVAKKIMDEAGIPIDDLYAVAKPVLAKIQKPDKVHFEDEGSKLLAKSVVESILKAGK